jgi:hypothetical protein
MHGLIFETSIWLLAGSTRLLSWWPRNRTRKSQTPTPYNRLGVFDEGHKCRYNDRFRPRWVLSCMHEVPFLLVQHRVSTAPAKNTTRTQLAKPIELTFPLPKDREPSQTSWECSPSLVSGGSWIPGPVKRPNPNTHSPEWVMNSNYLTESGPHCIIHCQDTCNKCPDCFSEPLPALLLSV